MGALNLLGCPHFLLNNFFNNIYKIEEGSLSILDQVVKQKDCLRVIPPLG